MHRSLSKFCWSHAAVAANAAATATTASVISGRVDGSQAPGLLQGTSHINHNLTTLYGVLRQDVVGHRVASYNLPWVEDGG